MCNCALQAGAGADPEYTPDTRDNGAVTRIVALGDSHLDRLLERQQELACPAHEPDAQVWNWAVGGSRTRELAGQLDRADVQPGDRVVISIGTNDAASWYPLPLAQARDLLEATLEDLSRHGAGRVVLLTTPGVDRLRLPQSNEGTEADLRAHARAYAEVARARGHTVVDAAEVLAGLGAEAFAEDGLHLSRAGYDRLVPVLRDGLCEDPSHR